MRGDIVIIRVFGGEPVLRRVWDVDKNKVYITDDLNMELLSSGKHGLEPIGFPREDVFKFDNKFSELIKKRSKGDYWDWSRLILYN